ncbi:MAG: FkbM family methyltransferase [Anaerolineae bacterium]
MKVSSEKLSFVLRKASYGLLHLSVLFSGSYQPVHHQNLKRWRRDNGDKTLRLQYDLAETSVVFDLGGYEGQWASDISAMYRCQVLVFEPIAEFVSVISQRFSRNPSISIYQFGLASETRIAKAAIASDGTSMFKTGKDMQDIRLVNAMDFFHEHQIDRVDLMKINIEGGEYELLEYLIETGLVSQIKNIQVQFHQFVPHAEDRMVKIQKGLSETHFLSYQYTFVWENWCKKESD